MLSLSLNINNRPFRQRLKLITVVTSLSIMISVVVTVFIIKEYEHTVEQISKEGSAKLDQISLSFEELANVHTGLFNLYRTTATQHAKQAIYPLGDKLINRLDVLLKNIATAQNGKIDNIQITPHYSELASIRQELVNYRNSARTAIKLLSLNAASPEKHILKATDSFNQINSHISRAMAKVTYYIDHEILTKLQTIKKNYWPMSIVIILLTVFMLIIFYNIITALSNNFNFIDKSLNDLRSGNTGIEIPVYTENNEMGKIYSSLDKFRASLIELRQSEHELSEKNRLLIKEGEHHKLTQHELKHSLTELSRAMMAADASSRAKSLFLANISHEIRTPLNAVLGMAQVLQTTKLDESQTEYVEMLYNEGRQLLQLLNNILDFSKMESGKLQLDYRKFRLDNLLDEVSDLFKNQPSAKDISLKIELAPDVENLLCGDSLRIRQILVNLLSNAYKFTRQGEIIIRVENHDDKSAGGDARSSQGPNQAAADQSRWQALFFSISDTGIGIDKVKQHYIFDNFTQADESLTREYGGTGIGLAICKQLVNLMHGEIGVNSEPGQGSTFWFHLRLPGATQTGQQQSA